MPRDLFLHEDELAMTLGTIRSAGGSLNDLLCTATHAIAEAIRAGYQLWIAPHLQISQVYLSGAGTRNGFLWKLLQSQFAEQELFLTERLGILPLAREASAAAVLTALSLDGVTANLPLLTGAAGGRMIGRWVPGDARNWARVTAWAAEQLQDYRFLSNRAA
jgi:anhydro-N-acetylmuramic acid kinase